MHSSYSRPAPSGSTGPRVAVLQNSEIRDLVTGATTDDADRCTKSATRPHLPYAWGYSRHTRTGAQYYTRRWRNLPMLQYVQVNARCTISHFTTAWLVQGTTHLLRTILHETYTTRGFLAKHLIGYALSLLALALSKRRLAFLFECRAISCRSRTRSEFFARHFNCPHMLRRHT